MKLIIKPPVINNNTPFDNDLLEREAFGGRLVNLIQNIDDNIVLSLQAPWGEGKTTFVKMWQGLLLKNNIRCIYFDAFENDYLEDTYIAITSELVLFFEREFADDNKRKNQLRKFKSVATKVGGRILSVGTKIALRTATMNIMTLSDMNDLKDIGREIADGTAEEISNYVADKIENRKEEIDTIDSLKEQLEKISLHIKQQTEAPLVFIVDELDRCRPDYALDLLEKIKHFFSVNNIVFVLILHRKQLEASVTKLYGDNIDAPEYLQKFINLEINLPKKRGLETGDYKSFCDALYDAHELNVGKNQRFLQENMISISQFYNLSLRELERCYLLLTIFYASVDEGSFQPEGLIAFLIILRIKKTALYYQLSEEDVEFQELQAVLQIDGWEDGVLKLLYEYLEFALMSEEELLLKDGEGAIYRHHQQKIRSYYIERKKIISTICNIIDSFNIRTEKPDLVK